MTTPHDREHEAEGASFHWTDLTDATHRPGAIYQKPEEPPAHIRPLAIGLVFVLVFVLPALFHEARFACYGPRLGPNVDPLDGDGWLEWR